MGPITVSNLSEDFFIQKLKTKYIQNPRHETFF